MAAWAACTSSTSSTVRERGAHWAPRSSFRPSRQRVVPPRPRARQADPARLQPQRVLRLGGAAPGTRQERAHARRAASRRSPCRGSACVGARRPSSRAPRRDRCTVRSGAPARRARGRGARRSRARSALARLERCPVRDAIRRLEERRVRAGAQHSLVVVRLQHEHVRARAECRAPPRSHGRRPCTPPRATPVSAQVSAHPHRAGARRAAWRATVTRGARERARSPPAPRRCSGASASSRDAATVPAVAYSAQPHFRAAAAAPCTWSVCSCVTMQRLDRRRRHADRPQPRRELARREAGVDQHARSRRTPRARRSPRSRCRAPRPSCARRASARAYDARSCARIASRRA